MPLYKSLVDGSITVGLDPKEYVPIGAKEFIDIIESNTYWWDVDPDVYEQALAAYGLDYDSYYDPEDMWADFLAAYKREGDKLLKESRRSPRAMRRSRSHTRESKKYPGLNIDDSKDYNALASRIKNLE